MPYFSPSNVAKRGEPSVSVIQIVTLAPNSLPFLAPTSTAVSMTLWRIARPSLLSLNPKILKTDSLRPTKLTTKETELLCIYWVFLASIGFNPLLVKSEISFFLNAIEANAGFNIKASLALK